jgi:5-methylcytosine-specific restriction endonuclease McrA
MKGPEKQCPKCRRRQSIYAFMLAPGERPSLFCQSCRKTEKTCRGCGKSKSIIEFSSSEGDRIGFCKPCYANARASIYAHGRARADAIWRERHGTERPAGTSHYDRDPAEVLRAPKRRRAKRLKQAKRAPIDREAIFERDGWLCGICGEPVEADDATLDHIVPISLGGADEASNVRLAHSLCNSRRGDGIRYPGPRRPGKGTP